MSTERAFIFTGLLLMPIILGAVAMHVAVEFGAMTHNQFMRWASIGLLVEVALIVGVVTLALIRSLLNSDK